MTGADRPRPLVLITGGARRVGAHIAAAFVAAGCDLIVTYNRSEREAEQAAERWRAAGAHVTLAHLPLDEPAETDARAEALAAQIAQAADRLDVLVHNASVYFSTPLAETTPEDAARLYAINALAPLLITKRLAPLLARTKLDTSAVVCMCDMHAMGRPRQDFAAYSMSKAALAEMVRSLARDLAPRTRVVGVAPGVVQWPDDGYESDENAQRAYLRRVPLQRAGTPEEAAEVVRWLALKAGYITGEILRLDGGRSLA